MESIVREKAWIVKNLSSLYKDGEHNVIKGLIFIRVNIINSWDSRIKLYSWDSRGFYILLFNPNSYSYFNID